MTQFSEKHRLALLATSILTLLAAAGAVLLALVVLARRRQAVKQAPQPLLLILLALGVAFPLTNVLAQVSFDGSGFDNVLGSRVTGWHIVWGLVFLVAFALPPILTVALRLSRSAAAATWAGWLFIVLSWQIADTPTDGEHAATGLYLSWLVWVATLVGTLVLATRKPGRWPACGTSSRSDSSRRPMAASAGLAACAGVAACAGLAACAGVAHRRQPTRSGRGTAPRPARPASPLRYCC